MERIPCEPNPECKYFQQGCREDTHHTYYPSPDYTETVERMFRNLPENQVEICRVRHETLHYEEEPPRKPSNEVMAHTIIASGVHISRKAKKRLGIK